MFKKGESGNPAGRRPGESPLTKYRKMLASRADELISQVIDLALSGDAGALKMCLDRLIPAYKPEAMPVNFPIPGTYSLAQMGTAVLSAISSGDLPPDQGTAFIQALTGQAKLIELEELTKRIELLEETHAKP